MAAPRASMDGPHDEFCACPHCDQSKHSTRWPENCPDCPDESTASPEARPTVLPAAGHFRCEICGKDIPAESSAVDMLDHLRTVHPDAYGDGPERWPDGDIVIHEPDGHDKFCGYPVGLCQCDDFNEARRDLRESIARDIEAEAKDCTDACDSCRAYRNAAAIARGGTQ